jgi:hypothetical protein
VDRWIGRDNNISQSSIINHHRRASEKEKLHSGWRLRLWAVLLFYRAYVQYLAHCSLLIYVVGLGGAFM